MSLQDYPLLFLLDLGQGQSEWNGFVVPIQQD